MNEPLNRKAEKTISCRPDQMFYDAFVSLLDKLDVPASDLAERAMKKGLQIAVEEIRREKLAETKKQTARLSEKLE